MERCPYCDGVNLEVYRPMQVAATNEHYVWCHGCDAHGPIGDGPAEAIRFWNFQSARTPGPATARVAEILAKELNWKEGPASDDEDVTSAWFTVGEMRAFLAESGAAEKGGGA